MEAIDLIKRIWEANDVLWNRRVVPLILEPLEKKGGLDTNGLWDHVLATAFGGHRRHLSRFSCYVIQPSQDGCGTMHLC
jgi:hypothetical protein